MKKNVVPIGQIAIMDGMNNEQVEQIVIEIADNLIDGVAVYKQLSCLIEKYPVENHDEIRDAFWEFYENSCFSEQG